MFKTCPATAHAAAHADLADADDAPGNAPRDPARDATPDGRPHCKNDDTKTHAEARTIRSNPAVRTAASSNRRSAKLGAGPRAPLPRQLTWLVVHAAAGDSADFGRAAARDLGRSHDTAGSPDHAANDAPLDDMTRCNNALADAPARTAVRIP